MTFFESPIFWVILAAISEILSLIPNEKVKSNGLFQLLANAIDGALRRQSK